MRTECHNRQTWTLIIGRDDEDDWPDLEYYGRRMRPDRLVVHLSREDYRRPVVNVSGLRLKADGTAGTRRLTHHVWSEGRPPWMDEALAAARAEHNLTDEALERP